MQVIKAIHYIFLSFVPPGYKNFQYFLFQFNNCCSKISSSFSIFHKKDGLIRTPFFPSHQNPQMYTNLSLKSLRRVENDLYLNRFTYMDIPWVYNRIIEKQKSLLIQAASNKRFIFLFFWEATISILNDSSLAVPNINVCH
jgi:hypothetical protein